MRLAKAAVASCAAHGFHVSATILDASGAPKLYYVPDGTTGSHAYTGFRKANAALLIGAPSEQLQARTAGDQALAAKVSASTTYVGRPGGLPILVKGQVVGAVGISGSTPPSQDETCAADGLRAIQDQSK